MASVNDWVEFHAGTRGGRTALRSLNTGEIWAWSELNSRVGRLASSFQEKLGLTKGDCIVSLTEANIRSMQLQFACIRSGTIFAPLNFRLAAPELEYQVGILTPKVIVHDDAWADTARALAESMGIPHIISWGSGAGSEFDRLSEEGEILAGRKDAKPDDAALVLFTSGTTGAPKGAITTLGAMVYQALNQHMVGGMGDPHAHGLSPLPLFHAGALHTLCNPLLFFGGELTVSERFNPAECVRFAGNPANNVTHMVLVPLMYQMMAETAEFADADFSKMRGAFFGGGRATKELRDLCAPGNLHLASQYGSTETGPTVTSLDPARSDKLIEGSCGQKAPFIDIRLVDEHGKDVAQGRPGEIWVRGPAVTAGYFGRDNATDFTDGWFRTGDVATCDLEGFYFVVGRLKEMYKSGGESVFPIEVETVLASHPDVLEVAVVSIPHVKWGEVGLAVVVAREGATLTLESVHAHCSGKIARFKYPAVLEIVQSLPLGPMNKVAKNDLRQRFLAEQASK